MVRQAGQALGIMFHPLSSLPHLTSPPPTLEAETVQDKKGTEAQSPHLSPSQSVCRRQTHQLQLSQWHRSPATAFIPVPAEALGLEPCRQAGDTPPVCAALEVAWDHKSQWPVEVVMELVQVAAPTLTALEVVQAVV